MDCSTVLHLQLEFLFIFDHSCGHDWHREDGLNAKKKKRVISDHIAEYLTQEMCSIWYSKKMIWVYSG
jgi:hypothetical protein